MRSEALNKEVEFRGARKAFSASANPDKLRMFSALREIVAKSELVESSKPRELAKGASTKAYHYLEADVGSPDGPRRVGVTIREDNNGHLYYNHSMRDEEGRAAGAAQGLDRSKAGPGDAEGGTTLDQKISPQGDEINLTLNDTRGAKRRGSITFREGHQPLIKLFADADASTAVHEMGHQWLEELLSDASHPKANVDLVADAATVRKWLGNDGGGLTTAQHEQFAKGLSSI